MRFKEYYLTEMSDYVATNGQVGGDKQLLQDLKDLGYKDIKIKKETINIDLKRRITYSVLRFNADWRKLLEELKKHDYTIDRDLFKGISMYRCVLKKHDCLYEFAGDLKPITKVPSYVQINVVNDSKELSDQEVNAIIQKAGDGKNKDFSKAKTIKSSY